MSLSRLVFRAGYGIRLHRFLTIAFLSILQCEFVFGGYHNFASEKTFTCGWIAGVDVPDKYWSKAVSPLKSKSDLLAQKTLYFVLNFHKIIAQGAASHRHVWLYESGDYQSFSRDIHETNWEQLENNDIDIYAKNVTDQISELAKNIFRIKQSRYDSLVPLG